MVQRIEQIIFLDASPDKVWEYLTNPDLMKQWMGEPEMNIEVSTNWIVGDSISVKGFHHIHFENIGTVLKFNPQKIIQYSHLSLISRLPDISENYSIISFEVEPRERNTLLKISVENFPTETIYRHLNFYWKGTAGILKNFIEKESETCTDKK